VDHLENAENDGGISLCGVKTNVIGGIMQSAFGNFLMQRIKWP